MTIKGKIDNDLGVWKSGTVDLIVIDWLLLVTNSYSKGLKTQQFP